MNKSTRAAVVAVVILAILAAVTQLLTTVTPADDPSPTGYRVAAQYFHARAGRFGAGLNLLVGVPASRAEVQDLTGRLRSGAAALVVLQNRSEAAEIAPGLKVVAGATLARPLWPDPVEVGVTVVPLSPSSFGLTGPGAPPLLATPGGNAVLTRLQVGRGSLFLICDPAFFTNASIAARGHLQVLANLISQAGGKLNFAAWPQPPWSFGLPNPGAVSDALLALVPGLLLLLWALGARFGAVRQSERAAILAPDDRSALGWLMRRRQAGRLALQTLFEEHREVLPAALRREIEYRLAQGPVNGRELRQWQHRIEEIGGRRFG